VGASFEYATRNGFTKEQLYSTASYKNHDLSGLRLEINDLTGWNFAGQNLTSASFGGSTLTNIDLTDAVVVGASFGQPSSGGAASSGFTKEQLYSTASYQNHDLSGIRLGGNDLSGWNFAGQNLTNAFFYYTTLTNANLSQSILTGANFYASTLTNADLTDAIVVGASFWDATSSGFTKEQLYSTASYKNHDLSGIGLDGNDLTGWNFAGQNLSTARFDYTVLTDADLTDAIVVGASFGGGLARSGGLTKEQLYSTASYENRDLSGIDLGANGYGWGYVGPNDLTGWNFASQNLTNANFSASTLTGVDLTDAAVAGADFRGTTSTGFTKEQLYSTASYKNHDLSGIGLSGNDLTGWNFADAIVVGADFGGTTSSFTKEQLYSTASYKNHDLSGIDLTWNDLTGWNFAGQNLTNATFFSSALTDGDFRGADTRGAHFYDWSRAIVGNTILPDGHTQGVDLGAGQMLVIRDYDGNPQPWYYSGDQGLSDYGVDQSWPIPPIPPIPIHVDDHFVTGPGGVLQMHFESDQWDSTILFEPAIPVTLTGGTLELAFADGVNLASQLGRTFDLFDWTGVEPFGEFAISSPYAWDLSNLYTIGEVTFIAVPEPSCIALVLVGVSSMALCKRR
jgi:uncharacterized protein YjbI with pentapeptide repeats